MSEVVPGVTLGTPAKKKVSIDVTVWQKGQQLQKKRLRDRIYTRAKLGFYDRGPGPAGYLLPPLTGKKDHDKRFLIAPEYTLRPFLKSSFSRGGLVGPGVGRYLIPGDITHRGRRHPEGRPFGGRYETSKEALRDRDSNNANNASVPKLITN